MKMKFVVFGIDLAKLSFDVCFYPTGEVRAFTNDLKGFRLLWKWLISLGVDFSQVRFVMENTGRYGLKLCRFLEERSCWFTVVPALVIKRSSGIQRGKSDPICAGRIAEYGQLHMTKLKASSIPANVLLELKSLRNAEQRLVRQRAGYKASISELKATNVGDVKAIIQSYKKIIKALSKEINGFLIKIRQLIKSQNDLNKNYRLLLTIKGIGPKTATLLLVITENFTRFESARKLACYCGIAPFPYRSGTSVNGKTRVSHLANKELKRLLHQCSLTAFQHDAEIRAYYEKKTGQNKHFRCVVNSIKNKLLRRVFAVINRQTPFVNTRAFAG